MKICLKKKAIQQQLYFVRTAFWNEANSHTESFNITLIFKPKEVEAALRYSASRVLVKIPTRGIIRRLVCITWFWKLLQGQLNCVFLWHLNLLPKPKTENRQRRNGKTNRYPPFILLQTINILWRKFNTIRRLRFKQKSTHKRYSKRTTYLATNFKNTESGVKTEKCKCIYLFIFSQTYLISLVYKHS